MNKHCLNKGVGAGRSCVGGGDSNECPGLKASSVGKILGSLREIKQTTQRHFSTTPLFSNMFFILKTYFLLH